MRNMSSFRGEQFTTSESMFRTPEEPQRWTALTKIERARERSNKTKPFTIERREEGDRQIIIVTENGQKTEYEIFKVTDPDDQNLVKAYELFVETFKPVDLDSFENTQDMIRGVRYGVPVENKTNFYIVKEGEKVVAVLTGSVMELETEQGERTGELMYLGGFGVTRPDKRKYGFGRETFLSAISDALIEANRQGKKLVGAVGECTWTSERFWNNVGRKRVYVKEDDGSFTEIEYYHPPLTFDVTTGLPEEGSGEGPEHLMVDFFLENGEENPHVKSWLISSVNAFNRCSSYIPSNAFQGSQEAYERHVAGIKQYEQEFADQFQDKEIVFLTRKERLALQAQGVQVKNFITESEEAHEEKIKPSVLNADTM